MTTPLHEDAVGTLRNRGWVNLLGGLVRLAIPLGLLAGGGVAFGLLSIESAEEKAEPVDKQVLRTSVREIEVSDYPVMIHTNGTVQAHNEVSLSALVSGQVTKINPCFEVGAYFSEGDILLELDATDYENAVALARAQELSADSALELATQTYERMRQLIKSNNIAEAEFNLAAAERKQAAAQLDAARAAVQRALNDLDRTQIRAPFDGRLRQKSVGLGQSVGPGSSLGVAFAVDFAEVRLPIGTRDLQFLKLPEHASDPPVAVTFYDSVNPTSGIQWRGNIVRTEGALDQNSLELFVIARVDDPYGLHSAHPPLRIGQPVTGQIEGKVLEGVIALPRSAVRQLDQVYVVNKSDLTLTSAPINPLWTDENYVIVGDATLPINTLLSTTHLIYAPDGAKVEIIPEIELAAMNVSTSLEKEPETAAN